MEEAPVKSIWEVVALCPAAAWVKGSYEARKSVPATAAATCPPVVVLRSDPDAMEEIQRFVELAVVAETIVVEANGIVSAEVAGAEKLSAPPETASAVPVMSLMKSDPIWRFVTVSAVVVARLVVENPISSPCENVEEAPVKSIWEVVAEIPAAGCVQASYEERPPPVPHALALAETVPSAPTWRQRVPEPPAEETRRFVVDAVPDIES